MSREVKGTNETTNGMFIRAVMRSAMRGLCHCTVAVAFCDGQGYAQSGLAFTADLGGGVGLAAVLVSFSELRCLKLRFSMYRF